MRKANIYGRQTVNMAHNILLAFLKYLIIAASPHVYSGSQIPEAAPRAKQLISQEMQENSTSAIRQIARKLDFSNATTREILRKKLEAKPFQFHRCQELRVNTTNNSAWYFVV